MPRLVAWRHRLDRSAHGSHGAMLHFRRDHDGGASLTAAIIVVVVGAGLAHDRQRQYKESKVK
ncbi:MAG: hypothetical protein JSV06_13110 [Myxococcales bacterium]|nr:MAG: hypothetical protein JSV06_13110 [Myxococcales bacterium]